MSQFADQLNDRNSEIFILTWEAVKNHVLKEDFDLPATVQINGFIEIIQNEPFQGHWEFDVPCTKFLPGLMTCFYVPDQECGSQKVQINIFYEILSISTISTTTLTSTAPVTATSQTVTTLSTTRPTTTSQTTITTALVTATTQIIRTSSTTKPTTTTQKTTTTAPVTVTTKPSTTTQTTTTTKKPKPTKQPICEYYLQDINTTLENYVLYLYSDMNGSYLSMHVYSSSRSKERVSNWHTRGGE